MRYNHRYHRRYQPHHFRPALPRRVGTSCSHHKPHRKLHPKLHRAHRRVLSLHQVALPAASAVATNAAHVDVADTAAAGAAAIHVHARAPGADAAHAGAAAAALTGAVVAITSASLVTPASDADLASEPRYPRLAERPRANNKTQPNGLRQRHHGNNSPQPNRLRRLRLAPQRAQLGPGHQAHRHLRPLTR